MHASNLLKAVLKPRSLSTTSGKEQSLATPQNDVSTKGKRISSPDFSHPSASVTAKKSSHSSSPPVKVVCLCSPTNHPGSFRCRLHRADKSLRSPSASSSKASSSSSAPSADLYQTSMIRASGMHNLATFPGRASSNLAKSPPGRTSRLNRMVGNAQSEEDTVAPSINEESVRTSSTVGNNESSSMRTSACISIADSSGEIYSEYCQSTSKKAMDLFDRNMTRMYL